MNSEQIQEALKKAKAGIIKYTVLTELFSRVNVLEDREFQRKYNAFYRVQRRSRDWYLCYYALMQELRAQRPIFSDVLDRIHAVTGKIEPSFASKLVATIDPSRPIWDVHVLKNTGQVSPGYHKKNRLALTKEVYISIEDWYLEFLESVDGKLCIREFDQFAPECKNFTAVKKVDFILWQMRSSTGS